MKHKKYLRKQVDGDDGEAAMSDEKDDDESGVDIKYIKKEGCDGEIKDLSINDRSNFGKYLDISRSP